MITVQVVKPANILLPQVYRYMKQQFIDLFFEKGLLRLSSINIFKQYPTERGGDKNEGNGAFISNTAEGMQVVGVTATGDDAYIFCTSIIESQQLMNKFEADGYFKIKDSLGFSAAIANSIPGFSQSIQGFCNYQDLRQVHKSMPGMSTKDFTNASGELIIGGGMLQRLGEMAGDGTDLMFLKERFPYQEEAEYRFVWKINKQFFQLRDEIDIDCKEAVQFCEKVTGC
jgi:hypothetical protein